MPIGSAPGRAPSPFAWRPRPTSLRWSGSPGSTPARFPRDRNLLAERDGRIDAVLSLSTGELIADPFRRTAELRELLRCHSGGLLTARQPSPTPKLRPRPLPVGT